MAKTLIPEPHCCIFHPRIRALETYNVQDTHTKLFFRYGLCPICANRLKKQESFKQDINDRLEELAEQLKQQEEKRANKI